MKPISNIIFKWNFIFLITAFSMFNCTSQQESSIKTDDYSLTLQYEYDTNPLYRKVSFRELEIVFVNSEVEDVLSGLLNLDRADIFMEDNFKKGLVITAEYRNLRRDANLSQSKEELLKLLEKEMNFKVSREFPADFYCLMASNQEALKKNLIVEKGISSSKVSTNTISEKLSFSSAKLSQIAKALSQVYNAKFMVYPKESEFQYTFDLEGVELKDLQKHLEENYGFILLNPTEAGFPRDLEKPAVVSFN